MNQKLVTLTGPYDATAQNQKADFLNLTNLQAGVYMLEILARMFPELTWNDFRPENWPITKKLLKKDFALAGPCTGCNDFKMGHCRAWHPHHCDWGNTADDIGNRINDVANFIGDKSSDAIRLLTDEEVLDGAVQIGSAIASQGGSVAFAEFMDSLGGDGGAGDALNDIISILGAGSQKDIDKDIDAAAFSFKDIPKEALWIGGGVLGLVALIMVVQK